MGRRGILSGTVCETEGTGRRVERTGVERMAATMRNLSRLGIGNARMRKGSCTGIYSIMRDSRCRARAGLLRIRLGSIIMMNVQRVTGVCAPPRVLTTLRLASSNRRICELIATTRQLRGGCSSFGVSVCKLGR